MAKKIRQVARDPVATVSSKKETAPVVRQNLSIVMAASEMVPFAKTGGLGDVMGALPRELVRLGHQVVTFVPLYKTVRENFQEGLQLKKNGMVPMGDKTAPFEIWEGNFVPGVQTFFIRQDDCFDRDGLYGEKGHDYPDNARRWILFSKAVAESISLLNLETDVLHCSDWHVGLIPFLVGAQSRRNRDVKTAFTIHNIAFQGIYDTSEFRHTNLPSDKLSSDWLEFYGKINLMKGAIMASDLITTVSEKYAAEIQTPEYGCGLDGVLRRRPGRLVGILNGIDTDEWNPKTDTYIAQNYDSSTVLAGKMACKKALLSSVQLPLDPKRPLLGCISRLTGQKGVDLFFQVMPQLLRQRDVGLVVLGLGEPQLEQALTELQKQFPDRMRVMLKMDNKLAHQIEAGSDFYLMPSRFEPCGLNQMYSLAYGTIPIVRATGGLDDTVIQYDPKTKKGNGFKFGPHTPAAFRASIEEALGLYEQPEHFHRLRLNGMAGDYSWKNSARKYEKYFRKLVSEQL